MRRFCFACNSFLNNYIHNSGLHDNSKIAKSCTTLTGSPTPQQPAMATVLDSSQFWWQCLPQK